MNENDRLAQSIDQLRAVVSSERAQRANLPAAFGTEEFEKAQRCLRENVRPRAERILASFAVQQPD